jgi:hypothetical protein
VRRFATQPSLVVIVSDFRDAAGWQRPLQALGARHELVAVEVGDPREGALPDAGELVVVDPETGELVEVHTSDLDCAPRSNSPSGGGATRSPPRCAARARCTCR